MGRGDRADAALALASAFLLFGFNTTEAAAMPELVGSLGGGTFLAGAQNSLYVLLAVGLRGLFGPLADRRGARLVMVIGALGFCLPCLALPFCSDARAVVALHLAQAVGLAAYHPCVSSYLTALSRPERIGRRLGSLRFVTTAAAMLGPALLFPLIGAVGYPAFFGVLASVALAGLLCVLALPTVTAVGAVGARLTGAPGGAAGELGSRGDASVCAPSVVGPSSAPCPSWRRAVLLALPLVLGLGYSVVLNYGQALSRICFPGMNEGLLFTFFSVGGLAGSVIAGRAFDARGAWGPVGAGLGCLAGGLALLTQGQLGPAALVAGGVVGGFGYYGACAACAAALGTLGDASRRGRLFSVQQSSLDVGIVLGGLGSAAGLAAGLSVPAAYLALSATMAAGALLWGILYPRER